MTHRPILLLALIAAAAPLATANTSNSLAGRAAVIDGDTIDLGSARIRLFGIDAVKASQTCTTDGTAWPCGQRATARLRTLVGSKPVTCDARDTDVYGRTVAQCRIDGVDIGAAMVEEGWATALTAFSTQYVPLESLAKANRRGIWNSTFDIPAAYRAAIAPPRAPVAAGPRVAQRSVARSAPTRAVRAADGRCAIKGNHSRRGDWIYHMPGTKYYAVTRAEDFFCSEADALAAGYRRARNN